MKEKIDVINSSSDKLTAKVYASTNDFFAKAKRIAGLKPINSLRAKEQECQPFQIRLVTLFCNNMIDDPRIKNHLRQLLNQLDHKNVVNKQGEFCFSLLNVTYIFDALLHCISWRNDHVLRNRITYSRN